MASFGKIRNLLIQLRRTSERANTPKTVSTLSDDSLAAISVAVHEHLCQLEEHQLATTVGSMEAFVRLAADVGANRSATSVAYDTAALNAIVAGLTDIQRHLLWLHVSGNSCAAIAQRCPLPRETIEAEVAQAYATIESQINSAIVATTSCRSTPFRIRDLLNTSARDLERIASEEKSSD